MKVAIPRLRSDPESTNSPSESGNSQRVGRACKQCRLHKTKCDGNKPVCGRCEEYGTSCYYEDGKKERTRKLIEELSTKTQNYEDLLQDLKSRVSSEDARRIEGTLTLHVSRGGESPSGSLMVTEGITKKEFLNPTLLKSSESAEDPVDGAERRKKARATGFLGNNSDIAWIQRLRREVGRTSSHLHQRTETSLGDSGTTRETQEDLSVALMSYYLNDLEIPASQAVEAYGKPSKETANMLIDVYFAMVHSSFPIIAKATFKSQYSLFLENPAARTANKWLAILNMIFAIAGKFSELARSDVPGEGKDHQVYFTRAKMLGFDADGILSHPDLQQVQVKGLMAFYLLATGQVNRSWKVCGMAVRAAIGLGMNLESTSIVASESAKEIQYRIWWSLYSLDHLLSTMTGRPSGIIDSIYTAPLPIPFEEESFQDEDATHLLRNVRVRNSYIQMITTRPNNKSNSTGKSEGQERLEADVARAPEPCSSLYFLHSVDLHLIAEGAIQRLYAAEAIRKRWTDIECAVANMNLEADAWLSKLPDVFNFTTVWSGPNPFARERLSLAFLYYSTKLSVSRPCLYRLNRRTSAQIQESMGSDQNDATLCVESACRMLDLIPDEPDSVGLYQVTPWWCVLHYLVQATTVLLLELSFQRIPVPLEVYTTANAAKKAIRWLHHMSENDAASHRAWVLCDRFMRSIALTINLDVNDLPGSNHSRQADQSSSATPTTTTSHSMQTDQSSSTSPTTTSSTPSGNTTRSVFGNVFPFNTEPPTIKREMASLSRLSSLSLTQHALHSLPSNTTLQHGDIMPPSSAFGDYEECFPCIPDTEEYSGPSFGTSDTMELS